MSDALVSIADANCRVNRQQSLRIADFQVYPGQHWCIFGGNGAGKSLLAKLIRGRLLTGRSHVRYGNNFDPEVDIRVVSFEQQQTLWKADERHDISEYSASAKDQGTTVETLIRSCRRLPANEALYNQLLETLDLGQLQESGIRYLSSGQMRKVLIAQALFSQPKMLILDNPLEAIDRQSRARIIPVLQQWMSAGNSTLLLARRREGIMPGITHLAIMDELALLARGERESIEESQFFLRRAARRPVNWDVPASLRLAVSRRSGAAIDPAVPLIELKQVRASYGDRIVLDNVCWTMKPGQHTLIEGPNGSGKSTLLSLISGENHMAYGQRVVLFGRQRGSGETVWDIKAHFGIVSNELHNRYVRGWRVVDVVVSGFFDSVGLYDDSGAAEITAARAWLRSFSIGAREREYYHELSFGEQRLVLLARAMVKQPTILILDEPCVGLDDYHRELILKAVERLALETSIIYVSHTSGEEPACINQHLRLIPMHGVHTVEEVSR